MGRHNIRIEGKAEEFINKIPARKKSLIINLILIEFIKNKKSEKILGDFFTEKELESILDNSKKISNKEERKNTNSLIDKKSDEPKEEKSFKIEL